MIRASLERDLRDLAKLRQAALLPNLLERLAAQTAQVLNVARAARETSPRSPIDEKTAESWIRGDVVAFEITAGTSVPGKKFGGLKQLRNSVGAAFRGGAVLYLGPRSYTYDDRLHVLPLDRLWAAA